MLFFINPFGYAKINIAALFNQPVNYLFILEKIKI